MPVEGFLSLEVVDQRKQEVALESSADVPQGAFFTAVCNGKEVFCNAQPAVFLRIYQGVVCLNDTSVCWTQRLGRQEFPKWEKIRVISKVEITLR